MIKSKVGNRIRDKYFSYPGFVMQYPKYSLISILARVVASSIVAIVFIQFMVYALKDSLPASMQGGPELGEYLRVILYFNLLGELQIVVDNILERFLPVPRKMKLRMLIQMVMGIVLIVSIFHIAKYQFEGDGRDVTSVVYFMGIVVGLVFVTLVSTSILIMRVTDKWVQSQKEIDIMKQEKLKMAYNSLQDKVNPHFLFNNLSVLKSLIIYDKDTAVKFTEDFTDVYRYVLQSKDKVLVSLLDELDFINSYIGLHKERLGEGINVKISVDKDCLRKDIAPLTLQLLVENSIKHNIASKKKPLQLEIIGKDNQIAVINSLNRKESSYSTNTGLENLVQRYVMLTEEKIDIVESSDEFMVKVPLV